MLSGLFTYIMMTNDDNNNNTNKYSSGYNNYKFNCNLFNNNFYNVSTKNLFPFHIL